MRRGPGRLGLRPESKKSRRISVLGEGAGKASENKKIKKIKRISVLVVGAKEAYPS